MNINYFNEKRMEDFLASNASAVFGLLGAIGGGVLSFTGSLLLKRSDFRLRTWDKLVERRIKAHESLIEIALDLRVMCLLGSLDDNRQVRRAPQILSSKESFDGWLAKFSDKTHSITTWLTPNAMRELSFLQDYLVSLHQSISKAPSHKYPLIGEVIRMDFIELSGSLEKTAFEYFKGGIYKMNLDGLSEAHKYNDEETKQRYKKMRFASEWEKIRVL